MKKFRKLLAFALVLAIMASYALVSTSAESYYIEEIYPNKDGTWVFEVYTASYDIVKVTVGTKTLTAGTDYIADTSGDFHTVTFQTSYTQATNVSDFDNIKIYYNNTDYVEFYKNGVNNFWNGILFWDKMALESFNAEGVPFADVLDFFVAKGIITVSENAGVKTYKNGNLDLIYIDSEYAYPADADVAENLVKCEDINLYDIKYLYDAFSGYETTDYFYYDYFVGSFGNRCLVDFSDCEAGEVPLESPEVSQIKEMILRNLDIIGKLNILYNYNGNDCNMTVKNADETKDLLTYKYVGDVLAVQYTLADGLTVEDNVYYTNDFGFTYALVFESPKIISGDNSKWDQEKKGDLTISSDANFEEFLCIYVDDGTVPDDAYTVVEGSTVVTLKEAYLSTLAAGTHTLDIVSKSGIATATFTIAAKSEEPKKEEPKKEAPKKEEPKEEIANTADNSAIGAFVALSVIGAAGFVSMKKKEN